jgi:opacity protein-like surface antigen
MAKILFKVVLLLGVLMQFNIAFAYVPFTDDKSYQSGAYLGIQAGYIYAINTEKYTGVMPSIKEDNNQNAFGGGVYLGYGYVFNHGNLPYLGGELGFNLRTNYSSGDLYGAKINARGGISADVLPGFFLDNEDTTLLYIRLGVEGDQFKLSGNQSGDKFAVLYRGGVGIEHQLVDHVYIRADYVFATPFEKITFTKSSNKYSSLVYLNTFTIGLSYRF